MEATKFIHSVRVPRIYKKAAEIVEKVNTTSASFKDLAFIHSHPNVLGIYGLASTTIQRDLQLDELIRKTQILVKNPQLNPWLAKVLIAELLWRKHYLSSNCKPVVTVLSFEEELREALDEVHGTDADVDPSTTITTVNKPRYVRINTLLMSIDDALTAFWKEGWILLPKSKSYSSYLQALKTLKGSEFIRDFHIPELLAFPPGTKFYDHPGYLNGKMILQDKASCIPAFLLNPKPGSIVLDMCAAPGMKTTQLAAIIENYGKIYAVERSDMRYTTLTDIVKVSNATCVETLNADILDVSPDQVPGVQYILVDPSCTGSGMVNRIQRNGEFEGRNVPKDRLDKLKALQSMILRYALQCFPDVKRVVYSTCSIYPEENEEVVGEALHQIGNAFTLLDAKQMLWNEWLSLSSDEYTCGKRCLYSVPQWDQANGFFVAVFERNFEVPVPPYKKVLTSSDLKRMVIKVGESKSKSKKNRKKPANPYYNWRYKHKRVLAKRRKAEKLKIKQEPL